MILLELKKRGPTPGVTKRAMNKILRTAFRVAGQYWHREFRPRHFTHAGARLYGYSPRAGAPGREDPYGWNRSYQGRKAKKYHHTLPLVYSGESRDLTEIQDIRATSKGVRVVLHSRGFNRRAKNSPVRMADEMTRVAISERRILIRVMDGSIDSQLRTMRGTTVKRIA